MRSQCVRLAFVLGALLALSRPVFATTLVTFNGEGYRDGSVTYSISGSTLTITLANTAVYTSDKKVVPSDVLTGVIFTLPGGISLTPQTATVAAGSTLVQTSTCKPAPCSSATTNVAGEFGYQTAPFAENGAPAGPNAGIGSAGQVVGNGTQFPGGVDLDEPINMNGLNFGIVGANYASSLANNGTQKEPLINNAVTFTLTIVGGTLLESQITNWTLVFGTDWTTVGGDTPVPDTAVPEPSSLVLLGSGFTALAVAIRRRRRNAKA